MKHIEAMEPQNNLTSTLSHQCWGVVKQQETRLLQQSSVHACLQQYESYHKVKPPFVLLLLRNLTKLHQNRWIKLSLYHT
ncbi:hypothetical protein Bca101_059872 [Brassica carinata]